MVAYKRVHHKNVYDRIRTTSDYFCKSFLDVTFLVRSFSEIMMYRKESGDIFCVE